MQAAASDDFNDLVNRASAAKDSADPMSAVPFYEAALKIKPDWMEGLWLTGSLLYGADQFRDAETYLGHLTALAPQSSQAWALLGLCEYETGDASASLQHMERATSLGLRDEPQMTLVLLFHEAALLTKSGRFDDSLEKYNSFFDSRVSDQQVIIGLGLLSLRRPLTPNDVTAADRDLVIESGNAFAAMLANDQPKASRLYQDLVAKFPNDPDVLYAYGFFVFGTDSDAAIEQWNHALVLDPANTAAHTMLAWALSLRGEQDAAAAHAKAALARGGDQALPHLVLGSALVEAGHVEQGLPHIEQAVRLQPANLEAHLALANAYSEAGRKADAQSERRRCLAMQTEKHSAPQP